jgi:hypothetical protein
MALIIGSIMGVGILNLPTPLAFYGPITLVSMALTTVGALVLAVLFASLSRRLPADGGPYAYARMAFGNGYGFANAWSYWITAWADCTRSSIHSTSRSRMGSGQARLDRRPYLRPVPPSRQWRFAGVLLGAHPAPRASGIASTSFLTLALLAAIQSHG